MKKLLNKGYKKYYNRNCISESYNLRTFDDMYITMEVCNGVFFFWSGIYLIGYTTDAFFAFSIKDTIETYTFEEFEKISKGKY